ncbi:hypothetical protein [uncultured Hymenobacter sp.]|uniref:hypothetical protein n=1 Tax=uncultured Hymenobacter sp. TaxID=170016 RepID=UPI0035CA6792
MSKMLMRVLGDNNRELATVLARVEQECPQLYNDSSDTWVTDELEERRYTLLLGMTYLSRLQRLLDREVSPPRAADSRGADCAPLP